MREPAGDAVERVAGRELEEHVETVKRPLTARGQEGVLEAAVSLPPTLCYSSELLCAPGENPPMKEVGERRAG